MKKILKTLCLFAFLFIANTSYGQTEQETKNWLQEKLSKYLIGTYSGGHKYELETITIQNCNISITYTRENWRFHMKFPTDNTWVAGAIYTSGKRIILTNLNTGTESFEGEVYHFKLQDGEQDLTARVNKALAHLATFCPKKKEAF